MFASSIYFSSFRGHLCKINRAFAAAGLKSRWPGSWARGGWAGGSGDCARTPPPLPNGKRKDNSKKKKKKRKKKSKNKKKKSLTSRAVFPGTSVINLRKRDIHLVRSQRLGVS